MQRNFGKSVVRWAWRKLISKTGYYGLFLICALWFTLAFASLGVESVVRELERVQGRLFLLILLAILLGRWAGNRKLWWVWFVAGCVLALPVIFLLMSDLFPELRTVLWEGFQLLGRFLNHVLNRQPVETFVPTDGLRLAWLNFLLETWTRADNLQAWFLDRRSGQTPFRSGAVEIIWGALLFISSCWSGAILRRSDEVLVAMLPSAMVMMTAYAFARTERMGMPALFLLGVLALHAAATEHENERRWTSRGLDYPDDLPFDFSLSSTILIGGIVLAAFIVPQINLRSALRGFLGLDRPVLSESAPESRFLADSLGIEPPTPIPPFFNGFTAGGMPRSHLLGMPPELQEQVVLQIRVKGPGNLDSQRYYWRSLAYDVYTGNGWFAGETESVRYERGVEVPAGEQPYALPVRQEVMVTNRTFELAFAAGEIFSVDHTFEIAWYPPVAGVFNAFGVRVRSPNYTVDSRFPIQHIPILLNTGLEYPDWVTNRYLRLPDSIPPRVIDLAKNLTVTEPTPFEKAQALETYLRGFEYSLSVPFPPKDRDIVDYFLFDLQRGYCDYYATAMVVMARSVGLPARLAIGYSQGRYDRAEDQYVVIGLNAHSWPEIYFPGFGWVPFEPTAGLAEIERLGAGEMLPVLEADLPPLVESSRSLTARIFGGFAWAAGTMVLLAFAWWLFDLARLRRQSPEAFYRQIVQSMYAHSRTLGVPLPASATPSELAASLTAFLETRFASSKLLHRLPGSISDLCLLSDRYNRLIYSPFELGKEDKALGMRAWRSLRVKIWLVEFRSFFNVIRIIARR